MCRRLDTGQGRLVVENPRELAGQRIQLLDPMGVFDRIGVDTPHGFSGGVVAVSWARVVLLR